MSIKDQLISAARLYKRVVNPVGFIARAFVIRCSPMLTSVAGTRACLDVGAGTAPYEATLRHYADVAPYYTLDVAPSDSTAVVADCAQIPFRDECVDLVVSFDVIQHIDNPGRMLDEACRVLKDNGHLILTFPFLYPECDARDFRRWTVEGMRDKLSRHGFETVMEQRRGGAVFAWTCWITWMTQHLLPGQRKSWRASRNWLDFIRATMVSGMTLPGQLLGWIALLIDAVLPSRGIYMGACILARKRRTWPIEDSMP